MPCPTDDLDWAKKALASRAPRFVVIKPDEVVSAGDEGKDIEKCHDLAINWGVFDE